MRHLSLLALLVLALPCFAQIPSATLKSAELWFDATASLGPFRGITKTARGALTGAPTLSAVKGFVEMDAKTLTTNNSLRDHDMRNTLDVEKYPAIRFDLDSVTVIAEGGDSTRIELVGRMSIHGVTRPLRIPAVLHRTHNELRVTGTYPLVLPNYGVTKLKRMLGTLSMNELIHVGIDVTFTANTAGTEKMQ
ncbi:MAG TPA: YceI family protein [Gemmatimonadaceae bacterium]|nr:YceI family protein [Gemmatimonadaceae bacterium]